MKRFALIGHPVSGSLSPRLFHDAYGGRYPYDLIDSPSFADAWAQFLASYQGINVTAPFKQDACAAVDRLSENARRTGAVNLVVKGPDGLCGYNTDVDGVLGAVRESGLSFSDALIVGTGGAARAAAEAARQLGCRVTVTGRSAEKAAALGYPGLPLDALSSWRVPAAPFLLVYTLPASAPVPEKLPLEGAVVLEAEYKQPALEGCGCCCYIGGKRWLLHQALAGYELFTGERPCLENFL